MNLFILRSYPHVFMCRSTTVVFSWLLLCSLNLGAQDPIAQKYGNQISVAALKEQLSILASDAMEGRETGKRGQKMAAAFIRAHFEELDLIGPVSGSYYQPVDLFTTSPGETFVAVGSNRYMNYTDIAFYGNSDSGGEVTVPLLFVGNGSAEALAQVDVKDKAVLILSKNEWLVGSKSVSLAREKGAKMVFVCNTETKEDFNLLNGQIKQLYNKSSLSLEKPSPKENQRPGLFVVSPAIIDKLFGISMAKLKQAAAEDPSKKSIKKIKPVSISYKSSTDVKLVKSENVLGYLEGTDKKDELLIITSHYDHIGITKNGTGDRINNGADDDGSGTVAVMEMARVFSEAKKDGNGPRRSILFMTVTGEESGLLGSDYYTQQPVFPLKNTVVNLNIDMVGRRDAQHKDSPPYLYVIGADKLSTELNTVSEKVNSLYTGLVFDYTYNDQQHPDRLYYRSDHWNFAKKNIPIIFYFDGIHEDYHKPSDEVDKIEFELLAKRTQCFFHTAWEIANRDGRIMPDSK